VISAYFLNYLSQPLLYNITKGNIEVELCVDSQKTRFSQASFYLNSVGFEFLLDLLDSLNTYAVQKKLSKSPLSLQDIGPDQDKISCFMFH